MLWSKALGLAAVAVAVGGVAAWGGEKPRSRQFIIDPVLGRIAVCDGTSARLARPSVQLADTTPRAPSDVSSERANLDLMEKLGLLEGHMMIGRALLEKGMVSDAMPHFGHPVRELYAYLKPFMDARGMAPFDDTLAQVESTARGGKANAEFLKAYDASIEKVNVLRATVPKAQLDAPKFSLRLIALLLEDVAEDYGESIERGRISNTVEYHDAMGFLGYTERLIDAYTKTAPPHARAAYVEALDEVRRAQAGFPSLKPPIQPPVTVSMLRNRSARVGELADKN